MVREWGLVIDNNSAQNVERVYSGASRGFKLIHGGLQQSNVTEMLDGLYGAGMIKAR